ncbi:hypothetical protein [Lactobacillus helveticus]|uniref:hypothetical protein n=1 Tax=Lactobacillus helveticus TaxID=1587 RepID=UPI001561F4B4|nr:hypothetical protein [Lactobacillus helveticus]MCT0164409.1 hypothetical protein [Lactobacillus helveticus]NRO89310.1 hypothetical protein [Lactobacillus helveticus]
MDKNKNEQVVRRSEDTMKYIAVISSLLTQQITFNGIPVSEAVVMTAVSDEFYKMIKTIGVTDSRLEEYLKGLNYSETSPEFIEFNSAVEKAVGEVSNAITQGGQ